MMCAGFGGRSVGHAAASTNSGGSRLEVGLQGIFCYIHAVYMSRYVSFDRPPCSKSNNFHLLAKPIHSAAPSLTITSLNRRGMLL